MRKLSDFSKKPNNDVIEIDIEMNCSRCMKEIEVATYSSKNKLLIAYCEDKHETKIEGFNFI